MPQANDALAALRDIHLPEAVSYWPPAPGWWAVLAATAVASAVACLLVRQRRRSAHRAALVRLAEVKRCFQDDGDTRRLAAALSNLLRRVALLRFPRRDVASLYGEQWLGFLSTSAPRTHFPAEVLHALERCLYGEPRAEDSEAAEAWITATGAWIRRTS
jgi:hypothetical protein